MIATTVVWIVLSCIVPDVLSDKNSFLKGFVTHELLGFLGVIVTITLASAANLHLKLNELEEKVQKQVFSKTRAMVKKSAYWLLGMLLIAFLLVVIKPVVANSNTVEAIFNGAALLVVFFNILVLIDLTQSAFSLEPSIDKDN
ncbi:MAG: hypothetical protein CO093_04060 [Alphaproteobacteria bacterium CG_4_9_14_3_um_filter_47_13]|nr:MAG: hypothetical protein CO093_04060 [Alphaproteobacteria bacterium CG_4_9_14_3_um_filter_47_13]